ncbi:hypothetical protein BLA24_04975 [Streptomyces cinnamoneus]|uniref:Uncharacterized protein n=1 Tax=Streptomyces cinnamoneus TaxID=53446 RepID=A0A2G1XNY9_STRCJ|nr:hypothetical protein [Streptomyces cinnamoneus]PHQ52911.1 hypothetical protein BLA24_04975 [Streptomyces cinnamoneus]PPT11428.1 hypothetical protein CYQ11_28555 [Streptomyces cinnamoneus]
MNHHFATRIAAGSVLLAVGGLACAAGTAQADDAHGRGTAPLTSRVAGLTSAGGPVGRAASLLKEEIPKEASGQVYLRSPLAEG